MAMQKLRLQETFHAASPAGVSWKMSEVQMDCIRSRVVAKEHNIFRKSVALLSEKFFWHSKRRFTE